MHVCVSMLTSPGAVPSLGDSVVSALLLLYRFNPPFVGWHNGVPLPRC